MSDLKLTAEETAIWDREYHDWAVAHSGEKARELADEHIRQRRARLEPTPTTNAPVGGVESRGAPLERATNVLRLTEEEQAWFDRVASKTATTKGTTLTASIEFAAGLANGIAAARMARTAAIVNDASARLAPAEPVAATVPMTRTDGYGNPNPEGTYLSPPPVVKKPLTPAEPVVKESLTTAETRTIEGDAVSARLTLDGCRVSMQVLAMDEAIRGKHRYPKPMFSLRGFRLYSDESPALYRDCSVYLRGATTAEDEHTHAIDLVDATAAGTFYEGVCGLLTAFNASRAKPATSPTLLEAAKAAQHYLTCGGSLADIDEALRAAIAREEASAREPNHGRTKWRQIARDWQARAESAERDLAACREQVKEAEAQAARLAKRLQQHDLEAHDISTALRAQLTAAEAERDRLAKEVAALKARADEAKGLLAVSGCALDTDIPELTRMGRIANAAMDASQVLDGGVPWRVARDIMDAEAAALKAAPPLAAERKYVAMHRNPLCDTAPPAAQVVEAAVKWRAHRTGCVADLSIAGMDLAAAVDAYLAAKGEVRA